MSAATVGLPLSGSGDTTADVAVDLIGGAVYQYMKLASGTVGSTVVAPVLSSAPSAAEGGLVVRPILAPSTEQIGNVGQAQSTPGSSDNYWWVRTVGSAAGSTVVDAQASSAGSTKLFGQVTVANPTTSVTITNPSTAVTITNPTTAVTVSNPTTSVTLTNPTTAVDLTSAGSTRVVGTVNVTSGVVLGAGSSANTVGSVALVAGSSGNMLGQVAQGPGSTSIAPWYVISTAAAGAGSTTVDANLSSAGSTRVVGTVNVSSGVVLGAGSSANTLGAIAQGAGSTTVAPWYVISTASAGAGSTVVDANLSSEGSTKVVGTVNVSSGVLLGAGTSATYQYMQSIPFSTGNVARTSVSTTVDTQVIASNASRKALVIANGSTTQTVGLGLTTAAVTTARANINLYLPPTTQVSFASNGDFPLYLGPVRGINLTSTTVTGGVIVTEFS